MFCDSYILFVTETRLCFASILGRIEHYTGWAHMQSVHACAVQTHFLVVVLCLKKGFPKCVNRVHFGVMFGEKCDICVKNGVPKTGWKKGDPPDANRGL